VAGAGQLGEVALPVDEMGGWVAAVDPRQRGGGGVPAGDEGRDVEAGVVELPYGVVREQERLGQVGAVAPGGAQRAECGGGEAGGGGAFAGGVRDRDPGAVSVLDEVKPVTADFVGG
jgi:hypothetical protein